MTRFLLLMLSMLMTLQTASAMNVDEFMDKHIAPISDFVADIIFFPIHICGSKVPLIIFWILIAGIFFTIYFRGMAIWGFSKESICSSAGSTSMVPSRSMKRQDFIRLKIEN